MEDDHSIYASTFNCLIDSISLFLSLKDLFSLLLLNRTCYNILINDGFWKRKLWFDFHIFSKKSDQTWLQRYKLAKIMGQIFIYNLCNNPPMQFNIGKKFNIEGLPDGNNQLLPYKGISAILIRPCLYYINDEHELYMVGEPNYDGKIYKVPELLDTNVTYLGGGPYDFFYIKEGNIIYYNGNEKRQISNIGNIVEFDFCYPFISFITNNGTLYQMIYIVDDNEKQQWKLCEQVEYNVVKVVQFADKNLYLDNTGKLGTRSPLLMKTINTNPSLNNVINLYSNFLYLNDKDELITINYEIEQLDSDTIYDDDSREITIYSFTDEFNGIKDVVTASNSPDLKAVRTQKGDIHVSIESNKVNKLNIKAKNLCYSPENIILII